MVTGSNAQTLHYSETADARGPKELSEFPERTISACTMTLVCRGRSWWTFSGRICEHVAIVDTVKTGAKFIVFWQYYQKF